MPMHKRKSARQPFRKGEGVRFTGRCRLDLMCESAAFVYLSDADGEYEELVAYGVGHIEVDVHAPEGVIYVSSEGRVWAHTHVADQELVVLEPSKFTTLDRPPPMSAEMAAMQRLIRQNSLERERMLDEMRKVQAETREAASLVLEKKEVSDANVGKKASRGRAPSVDGSGETGGSEAEADSGGDGGGGRADAS